jgi:hypothetical protein
MSILGNKMNALGNKMSNRVAKFSVRWVRWCTVTPGSATAGGKELLSVGLQRLRSSQLTTRLTIGLLAAARPVDAIATVQSVRAGGDRAVFG